MEIIIRKATPDDAEAIAVLSGQLGYSFGMEDTRAQINAVMTSRNNVAYVAVVQNKLVGWIHLFYTVRLECASYCEIGGLVVDEHYRGKGTGKKLIEHGKGWCKEKHCDTLRVRSNVKRTDAHKFYEHSGFTETKQQKVFEIRL